MWMYYSWGSNCVILFYLIPVRSLLLLLLCDNIILFHSHHHNQHSGSSLKIFWNWTAPQHEWVHLGFGFGEDRQTDRLVGQTNRHEYHQHQTEHLHLSPCAKETPTEILWISIDQYFASTPLIVSPSFEATNYNLLFITKIQQQQWLNDKKFWWNSWYQSPAFLLAGKCCFFLFPGGRLEE